MKRPPNPAENIKSAPKRPSSEVKQISKEKNKDASALIAEVAHELRLPIANIKLLVETLLDGALEDREVCRRMLKRAYQETDRLQALVVDLLSLEQVAERHELKCQWLSLRERTDYALQSIAKTTKEKEIIIDIEIGEAFQIFANPQQFDQVLLNLLENAAKFTGPGGIIKIKSGNKPGLFTIEDTGIGMAASEIPKIFSRFYRIDKGSSQGGTGLGLSIVKQVLDLHGAKIQVQSQEGSGSSFQLEFPLPGDISNP